MLKRCGNCLSDYFVYISPWKCNTDSNNLKQVLTQLLCMLSTKTLSKSKASKECRRLQVVLHMKILFILLHVSDMTAFCFVWTESASVFIHIISSPARSAQSYCCHLGRTRLRVCLRLRVRPRHTFG